LSGAFTATVNADLRVGTVEETITGQRRNADRRLFRAPPASRCSITPSSTPFQPAGLYKNLGVLLPGVSVSGGLTLNGVGTQDVGGSSGNAVSQLASHGGRGLDQRTTMNGLSLMLSAGVNNTPYVPNMGSTQEVTIDTSGVSAEAAEGGVRVNVIPKEGGQHLQGAHLRFVCKRVDAEQQLHGRIEGARLHDAKRSQEGRRSESGIRRPDPAEQAVVLRIASAADRAELGRRHVLRHHL
jgi:hypothetical protein